LYLLVYQTFVGLQRSLSGRLPVDTHHLQKHKGTVFACAGMFYIPFLVKMNRCWQLKNNWAYCSHCFMTVIFVFNSLSGTIKTMVTFL